jgi:hypothetical protein
LKRADIGTESSTRIDRPHILSAILGSTLLILAGCFGGEDGSNEESSISERLATADPCAFTDIEGTAGVLFGESPGEGQTEEIQDTYFGCSDRLSINVDGQDVGSMSVVSQVFADPEVEDSDVANEIPLVDHIEWFRPGSMEELNEVIDPYVEPISEPWNSGESYLLDGLFRNRDMYIVGAWGEVNGFGFGIAFKVTAEQQYYDQPLVYNEYCDATDLDSGCIVAADVLYRWMIQEYLPQIADKLSMK